MDKMVIGIWIAYAILGLWFFHKIYTVFYAKITNGIIRELIGASFFGFIMTYLTLKHWVIAVVIIIIVGAIYFQARKRR